MTDKDIDFFADDDKVQVTEHFAITNLEQAEWALRKIQRAQNEIDRFEAAAEKVIEKIKARVELIKKPHLSTIDYMTHLLEPWAAQEIGKQGKKKSYTMLSGTVGYRKGPMSIEVQDEHAALRWLEEHGETECIVTTKRVDKGMVKELIKTNGEVPDGVEVHSGDTKFYVNTNGELLENKNDNEG